MRKTFLLLTFLIVANVTFAQSKSHSKTKHQKEEKKEEKKEPEPPAEPVSTEPHKNGPAQFPGGLVEMMKYIHAHLIRPDTVMKGLSGKVYVYFKVEVDGTIKNAKISDHLSGCPKCDEEALKLVNGMPKWQPAVKNNSVIASDVNLPVNFISPHETPH